ncbi:MAG TPA: hypothetical protein VLC54_16280 [Anaeromyxobacter sp.]|nr:hypothetical protein [Anaeromyxobacter sp.]
MHYATIDRGEIIHFAARSRLSPALRDGAPALVGQGEPGRCGWEPFFRALSERDLAVALDPEMPGEARFMPRRGAGPHPGRSHPGPLEEARRFIAALRGRARSG